MACMSDPSQLAPYIEFRDVSKAFGDKIVLEGEAVLMVPGRPALAAP